jgi:hypothetical protein
VKLSDGHLHAKGVANFMASQGPEMVNSQGLMLLFTFLNYIIPTIQWSNRVFDFLFDIAIQYSFSPVHFENICTNIHNIISTFIGSKYSKHLYHTLWDHRPDGVIL